MYLSDEEVKNFREFVDRGGFVMLDDFDNAQQFESHEAKHGPRLSRTGPWSI